MRVKEWEAESRKIREVTKVATVRDNASVISPINVFMVGSKGENIVILNLLKVSRPFSKADALNLAAYLVAMADDGESFSKTYKAISNT
jgi:hypothetical protein